jgi:hypothetical protein
MKVINFNALSLPDKAEMVATCGKYLLTRSRERNVIHLYALGNQFVAVQYDVSTRKIWCVELIQYCALDMFLEKFSLRQLNI